MGKSELIHFSRCRNDEYTKTTPSVTYGGISVFENRSRPYTEWLGVYFDKSMSFKRHTRLLTGKAIKVANALRCLSNISRGASPIFMRQAVLSCVLHTAYFAAETWWPGFKRISTQGRLISNRVV